MSQMKMIVAVRINVLITLIHLWQNVIELQFEKIKKNKDLAHLVEQNILLTY